MTNPAPGYLDNPDYSVRLEPCPRRVRVEFGGQIIADTLGALYLLESNHIPVYYIPLTHIKQELLSPTDLDTHCPFKGHASYWTITVGDQTAENAVWSYPQPYDEAFELAGYAAFYWDKVDHWYEEDEEIFVHPRDPYKRIDVVPSSRKVRVVLGGEEVATTNRAMFLFETGLPTRYYLPKQDVRTNLLQASDTHTSCPYKGVASYWSARIANKDYPDVVWAYSDPIAECPKIKGLLCFFNEHVDAIYVDDQLVPTPTTKWSKK